MISQTGPILHGNGRVSVVSFIAADLKAARRAFEQWLPVSGYRSIELPVSSNDLTECITPPTRCAFLATSGDWTAYIDNDWIGNWPISVLFSMSERLRTRCVATSLMCQEKIPTSCGFGYWDGRTGQADSRTIQLLHDEGWEFSSNGDPLPFENLALYNSRKKMDRLSNEIVIGYAQELGIKLCDQSFYEGHDSCVLELRPC